MNYGELVIRILNVAGEVVKEFRTPTTELPPNNNAQTPLQVTAHMAFQSSPVAVTELSPWPSDLFPSKPVTPQ